MAPTKKTAKKKAPARKRKALKPADTAVATDDHSEKLFVRLADAPTLKHRVESVLTLPPQPKPDRVKEAQAKMDLFLKAFEVVGHVGICTKEVGISYSMPFYWAKTCPEFAKRWQEARKIAAHNLQDEAIRRGVEGVSEPVYQGGVLVGYKQSYSDGLLTRLLTGLLPETYKDRHEVTGKDGGPIETKHGLSADVAEEIRRKIFLGDD